MVRTKAFIFIFFFLIFLSLKAWPEEPSYGDLIKEIQALKARVEELEKKLTIEEGKTCEVEARTVEIEKVVKGAGRQIAYEPGQGMEVTGIAIGADATFILQGTPNANNAGTGDSSKINGSWSSDIEIKKSFEDWGLAFLHLEAGQGDGLESDLAVFSNVNRDAMASTARIEVTEAWYAQSFFSKKASITGGKLDFTVYFDQNEYANDETTQFLGRIFRNSPSIEFPPDNTLGFEGHISIEPIRYLEFDAGYFDADADWTNIFQKAFFMAQVNFMPAELFTEIDKENWFGNYRFYAWLNGLNHNKLVAAGTETTDNKEINYGFGFSFDQMLTSTFGTFCRFGWQRPDIALYDGTPTLEWSWSAGAQMTGKYWKRKNDVLAFAIGQAFPSKDWTDSSDDNYGVGEGHIEAYYKCQINDCLAISPDIQLIWNPNGVSKSSEGHSNPIFVYGARAQIDF